MHRNVKTKTEQNFNPGLTLIGLSGNGPRFCGLYPVVQKMDSAIHWINLCSGDKAVGFLNTYSLDGDLSDV